jgi:hypothetical protein
MKMLLALIAVSLCGMSFAQQEVPTTTVPISKNVPTSTWYTYLETSELKIEYSLEDCFPNSGLDFQTVVLRFTNLTGESMELSWHIDLDFDGSCKTCGSGEYDRTMTLEPNEVAEGSCDNESGMRLELFSKFIDPAYTKGAQLTAFKLSTLEVL